MNYDDGFIAWMSGKEVARRNVSSAADGKVSVKDHEAGDWEEIELGNAAGLLARDGAVLALQGFNNGKGSSDFTLDARLEAKWGGKTVVVLGKDAVWEYLANKEPEKGWQTKSGAVQASLGKVEEKIAGLNFRTKGSAEWRSVAVKSQPFAASRHRVRSAALEAPWHRGRRSSCRLPGRTAASQRFGGVPRRRPRTARALAGSSGLGVDESVSR